MITTVKAVCRERCYHPQPRTDITAHNDTHHAGCHRTLPDSWTRPQ